jgi:hypothetical protein
MVVRLLRFCNKILIVSHLKIFFYSTHRYSMSRVYRIIQKPNSSILSIRRLRFFSSSCSIKSFLKEQRHMKKYTLIFFLDNLLNKPSIKGTVSRYLRPSFFFIKQFPYRSLIHGMKPFCIWIRIRRENRVENVCDVYLFISFLYGFPLKGMRASILIREESRVVVKIYAVSLKPRDPIPRCQFELCKQLSPSMTPSNPRNLKKNFHVGSDPAVSLTPRNPNFANNYLEYLGEFEAICETA